MASEQTLRLAVLGLGTMGRAMARSAARAGIGVVGWNRSLDAASGLDADGIEVADSVLDAVAGADVVITMVTDAQAVISIAADQGLLDRLGPGAVWAQMSTIGVTGTERLVTMAMERCPGAYFVDAPVSGSKVPAEQGKLVIFASGPGEAQVRVKPVFDAIGQRTIWLGQAGRGSRMKLVNNTLLAFTAEGVSNALGVGRRLGFEVSTLIEAFDGSPLVAPWESAKFERIAGGEFSAEFALALALKDVELALSEVGAQRFNVLAALQREWRTIVDDGLGTQDVTVVARVLGE